MRGRLRSAGRSWAFLTVSKQGFTPTDAWDRLGEFLDLLPLALPTDGNLARAKERRPRWRWLVPALREGTERVDGGQGVVGVGAVVAGRVGQNVWPW